MPPSPEPCPAPCRVKRENGDGFPIVLGGRTAVEILRSARNAGVTLAPTSLKSFPERAPSRTAILNRLEHLLSEKNGSPAPDPSP